MEIKINVSHDYSKTPGGRTKNDGPYSGEDFRETLLLPKYLEAKENNAKLIINLDGGYGYGTSFLEEAFGGLARKLKDPQLLDLVIISDEEPKLIDNICEYIKSSLAHK